MNVDSHGSMVSLGHPDPIHSKDDWVDKMRKEFDEVFERECFRVFDSRYRYLWRIGYWIYYKIP